MITIEKVNKYFYRHKKNQIHVINDTSLKLDGTGFVAILGPSGCGKTTLLNVIGGLDKVSKGKIYINKQRITKRRVNKIDKIRNLNMGYIFQDYKLIDNMSVFDNIALVLKMVGIKDKQEISTRVNYVLETLGIYRYRNRPAGMLSGGERQRVGIARAIVKDPDIIIADEPTGNLDSKNTLEIMNIIKSISKTRLVILVTHEADLAKFYASRIIELADGKIVNDYKNDTSGELDYAIENNIYLKDFKNHNKINKDDVTLEYYSDGKEKIDLNIVVRNGNIYIQSITGEKIEIIDQNSNIELIDDHYKKIDKSVYQKYEFNFRDVINKDLKKRYSAILNPFTLIWNGFKKIADYSFLKKLLLIGFVASSMFILMSLSRIFGALNVEDVYFLSYHKDYLQVVLKKIDVKDYLSYEKMDNITYLMPGNSMVSFMINYSGYYQTINANAYLSASMAGLSLISEKDITYGRMPENSYELVFDELAINDMIKGRPFTQAFVDQTAVMCGVTKVEDMLGRKITLNNMKDFTIVGIVNTGNPSFYVDEALFISIINNASQDYWYGGGGIMRPMPGIAVDYSDKYIDSDMDISSYYTFIDYNQTPVSLKLKKGKWPQNDYEVVVNYNNQYSMPLKKTIDVKINDKKLRVVGYYTSKEANDYFLVSPSTLKYHVVNNKADLILHSSNKEETINEFRLAGKNIYSTYEKGRNDYITQNKASVTSTLIFSGVILAISLIEVFLMIRSSFLSRIKEIGIYRAIGVKKSDIYRMFLGEIIAITTIASLLGITFMTYILKVLTSIDLMKPVYLINPYIVLLAIGICYVFNVIIGLVPVYTTLRKTPAQILARHDIE